MKCFFQLVSSVDGTRTPHASDSRQSFADNLCKIFPDGSSHFVLVLVDDVKEEWNFSTAPLVTVSTFISQYASVEVSHG